MMIQRLKIEGVNLSNKLMAVHFRNSSQSKEWVSHVCHLMADNQVNLPFLSITCPDKDMQLSCCVASEDEDRVKRLIQARPELAAHAQFSVTVGLLSIFPHKSGMRLLGACLSALGEAGLPIHLLASSLSALTFVLDYDRLDEAVHFLRGCLDVPGDRIAYKPEIQVRQIGTLQETMDGSGPALQDTALPGKRDVETIAVYCEARIKTYGFQQLVDLSLLELAVAPDQIAIWGKLLQDMDDSQIRFDLVLIQALGGNTVTMYFVLGRERGDKMRARLVQAVRKDAGESIQVTSPVEMISFYGPHFGDRYGIADTAWDALAAKGIPVLAAGCSGSAIYMVLPDKKAQEAVSLLSEVFEVP